MLSVNQQKDKNKQIPDTLIQKGRMHVDVICPRRDMRRDLLRNIARIPHIGDRKLHGKETVIVIAEHFPVHEVSPAAYCLSEDQSGHSGVSHQRHAFLLGAAPDIKCDIRRDHATVNRKPAASQLENVQKIILVVVPRKHHIIKPCTDHTEEDSPDRQIPVVVRILPCLLCDSRHCQ